ncbi:MAG: ATP-binding cassette domain-containing protein [Proteobacteria bacterium]|nr:ATP-binding cassette domain-containing protein [Pseudomonadota bacterium]
MLQVDDLHRPGLGPVSFQIEDGECLALTGPSGAGKTLLLRAIVDLDPNRGRIAAAGRTRASVAAPEWRRLVAYLPAESGWWMERVGDHMPDHAAARELLDGLGFADPDAVLAWPVAQLSSGERQRLALARGLLATARVLLLDEPTSALDSENCALVEALLRSRLASGMSVLLVSHDVAQVARLAGHSLRLEQGKLVAAS